MADQMVLRMRHKCMDYLDIKVPKSCTLLDIFKELIERAAREGYCLPRNPSLWYVHQSKTHKLEEEDDLTKMLSLLCGEKVIDIGIDSGESPCQALKSATRVLNEGVLDSDYNANDEWDSSVKIVTLEVEVVEETVEEVMDEALDTAHKALHYAKICMELNDKTYRRLLRSRKLGNDDVTSEYAALAELLSELLDEILEKLHECFMTLLQAKGNPDGVRYARACALDALEMYESDVQRILGEVEAFATQLFALACAPWIFKKVESGSEDYNIPWRHFWKIKIDLYDLAVLP
ncbi:hypothetical protein V2J09_002307 [Rumex salicifolius]